jgi:ABC-2 type transport system ATP-binding protein
MIRSFVEDEGRTVFLSSHLLDEVERVCDHVAIVERGRVIAQGSIDELTARSSRPEVIIGADDLGRARMVLESDLHVREVREHDGALRVTLDGDPVAVSELNASLVHGGVGVQRLEPVRRTLEQQFLDITGLKTEVPV